MAKLTEDMIIARTKSSDLSAVKKLNCWGSDLTDISLVRRLTNVEVISLSLNKISSLADFQYCRNLTELYIRRNDIRDLTEIGYLTELPRLQKLLLLENPCVENAGPRYRATVLRYLPNLDNLDNNNVTPEEVEQAMKDGLILEHPLNRGQRQSPEPNIFYGNESPPLLQNAPRRNSQQYDYVYDEDTTYRNANNVAHSPPSEIGYYQNGDQQKTSPEPSVPVTATSTNNNSHHGITTTNIATISTTESMNNAPVNGNGNYRPQPLPNISAVEEHHSASPTNNNGDASLRRPSNSPEYYQRVETNGSNGSRRQSQDFVNETRNPYADYYEDSPPQMTMQIRNNSGISLVHPTQRTASTNIQRGGKMRTKIPELQTSNLLSAVLCLIPELDWASLEVVELAVKRRMDEVAGEYQN